MSSQNKNSTTIFFIFFISIILAILLAPVGGAIHKYFWGPDSCSLFIMVPCDSDRLSNGFIYFYTFFMSIFSFTFLNLKTALKVFISGTILTWLFIALSLFDALKFERKEYIITLITMAVLSVLGYLLALGINKLTNYYQSRKKNN